MYHEPPSRIRTAFVAIWALALPLLRSLVPEPTLAQEAPGPTPAREAILGSWTGALDTGGPELRIVFHIREADQGAEIKEGNEGEEEELTATMDSPDQGATGIPVSRVKLEGDSVTIAVAAVGGTYRGRLSSERTTIEGAWSQGGRSLPLTLRPAVEADTAPPPRPQHPEAPYPYVEEEVVIENRADGVRLAGTLTRPDGAGPHPAVVLVSGSGPQNRDSELLGHRPFLVLADHLTRSGIAVLRYDERGVGESGGSFEGVTSEDLARDVAAAVRHLRRTPGIDPDAVGLLGLSEGGLVAPLVHVRMEAVAFLVLMAAPAVPGSEVLVEQAARIAAAQGAPSRAVDALRASQRRLVQLLRDLPDESPDSASIEPLREEFERRGLSAGQVESQIDQITTAWFRSFVRHDPGPILREVDVPVLALYGRKDLQVPPGQNADPMRAALEESPAGDVTVRVLEGLNHLFQPAETGLPSEYSGIETTMAPVALEAVTDWIRTRVSLSPSPLQSPSATTSAPVAYPSRARASSSSPSQSSRPPSRTKTMSILSRSAGTSLR